MVICYSGNEKPIHYPKEFYLMWHGTFLSHDSSPQHFMAKGEMKHQSILSAEGLTELSSLNPFSEVRSPFGPAVYGNTFHLANSLLLAMMTPAVLSLSFCISVPSRWAAWGQVLSLRDFSVVSDKCSSWLITSFWKLLSRECTHTQSTHRVDVSRVFTWGDDTQTCQSPSLALNREEFQWRLCFGL